jgi:lipopolysaccharide/colanic/teichoic acid biosynthesis glycosyltransferase
MLRKWDELPVELQTQAIKPYYDRLDSHRKQLLIKRIFDVIVSAFGIIILSPIFLLTAIAIKIDTPGPVFFRQERVTQYGRVFKIFKFRSMVNDSAGLNLTTQNDSRITRTGKIIRKLKVDELCQLIDVFIGNMTAIGPRASGAEALDTYKEDEEPKMWVKPGITGYTQAYYRNSVSVREKRLMDAWYAQNVSLWLDIKILIRTVKTVIPSLSLNVRVRIFPKPWSVLFRGYQKVR